MSIRCEKRVVKSENDFNELGDIWHQIENGKDMTIYQSFDWNMLLYREEVHSGIRSFFSRIIVYICWNGINPVCIAPIVVTSRDLKIGNHGREKGISLLGYRSYSDYLNFIYKEASQDELMLIVHEIKTDYPGYRIVFTDVLADTLFAKTMSSQETFVSFESIAVEVQKKETVEMYNATLSKSVKQNLRTAYNRMKKNGYEYRMEIISGTLKENLINDLVGLHIRRMRTKNTDSTNILKKIESLQDVLLRELREKNNNVISESMRCMQQSFCEIVYLNDRIAGFLYGLYDGKTVRIMQNCVNDDYRFYSPMFRGAYDYIISTYGSNKIEIVDFTRGNEQYKYNLGGVEKKLISFQTKRLK